MSKLKGVCQCMWHQDILSPRSMTDFVIMSSDLQPYVLDTRMKRGVKWSLTDVGSTGAHPLAPLNVLWKSVSGGTLYLQLSPPGELCPVPNAGGIESEWGVDRKELLTSARDIVRWWKEYFKELLNSTTRGRGLWGGLIHYPSQSHWGGS